MSYIKQNLKNKTVYRDVKMIGIRHLQEIQMLRATNNCGLNFYGEKMILGFQKTGSIH